mmetsp:Transcript_40109/g.74120  ORF Transcript_40109/g.74120 Transcript_40109/m.74120 type:complete len:258 (+) Transcript_40109:1281-2054(+)
MQPAQAHRLEHAQIVQPPHERQSDHRRGRGRRGRRGRGGRARRRRALGGQRRQGRQWSGRRGERAIRIRGRGKNRVRRAASGGAAYFRRPAAAAPLVRPRSSPGHRHLRPRRLPRLRPSRPDRPRFRHDRPVAGHRRGVRVRDRLLPRSHSPQHRLARRGCRIVDRSGHGTIELRARHGIPGQVQRQRYSGGPGDLCRDLLVRTDRARTGGIYHARLGGPLAIRRRMGLGWDVALVRRRRLRVRHRPHRVQRPGEHG